MAASISSGVEDDACRDPFVGIDLEDAKYLVVERIGPFVAAERAVSAEHEVLAAGRNGVCCEALHPDRGECRDFGMHGIAALSQTRAHHPPAIVGGSVVGHYFSYRVPVAGHEVRPEALVHPARRVFQPPRPWSLFFEAGVRSVKLGNCGVDVVNVEPHLKRNAA